MNGGNQNRKEAGFQAASHLSLFQRLLYYQYLTVFKGYLRLRIMSIFRLW